MTRINQASLSGGEKKSEKKKEAFLMKPIFKKKHGINICNNW